MPFSFAHPAAVLPFRKLCPRLLSFPALVAGSLSPDVGYGFGRWQLDELSHRLIGSIVFCLPVGCLLLCLACPLRIAIALRLPAPFQQAMRSGGLWRVGSPLTVAVSILIGAWTHLVWDSFTNQRGWFVVQFAGLQTQVVCVAGHAVRICHLLWYGSSFAGVLWLCLAYQKWQRGLVDDGAPTPIRAGWVSALMAAGLVLPIGALHHLVHGAFGLGLVAVCTALLLFAFLSGMGLLGTDRRYACIGKAPEDRHGP